MSLDFSADCALRWVVVWRNPRTNPRVDARCLRPGRTWWASCVCSRCEANDSHGHTRLEWFTLSHSQCTCRSYCRYCETQKLLTRSNTRCRLLCAGRWRTSLESARRHTFSLTACRFRLWRTKMYQNHRLITFAPSSTFLKQGLKQQAMHLTQQFFLASASRLVFTTPGCTA